MNKLILCEGETDAILLSYYLGKIEGWEYCSKAPKGLSIKAMECNESVNWYKRNEDYLLICAVGGKDNFKRFYETRIKKPLIVSNAFGKIAFMTDRDDRAVEQIEKSVNEIFEISDSEIKNNKWISRNYQDSYGMTKPLDMLLVIIPKEHQGALETAMLEAISEDEYDRNIVEKTGSFANQMRTEASRYISTERLRLKSHLALTWAVQYPEKVFSEIDAQIKSVPWEKSDILRDCFFELVKI